MCVLWINRIVLSCILLLFLSEPAVGSTTAVGVVQVKRPIIVVIDPGHGGKDSGAIGKAGHQEKTLALAVSKQLQRLFNQEPGFRAELTRSRDIYIPLRERLRIARRYKPDLFLAVHADAAYNDAASGASVFALSERGATSEMARWLAKKENQSELISGAFVDKDRVLRSVLIDMSQNHSIHVSLAVGRHILNQLSAITRLHYPRVEQAGFVVLKSPHIPSLLIEIGYISNIKQEKQLMKEAYQKQIALAIVQGVKRYFLWRSG